MRNFVSLFKRPVKAIAHRMGFEIRRLPPVVAPEPKPAEREITRDEESAALSQRLGKPVVRGGLILGETTLSVYGYEGDFYFSFMAKNVLDGDKFYSFIKKNLPPSAVCLDVGANIGVTGLMLGQVARAGRVVCVEPSPQNFPLLSANIKQQTNCQAINLALGNSAGTVQFLQDPNSGAWDQVVNEDDAAGAGRANASVEQTTVDALVKSLDLSRLDFIKIDTEGSEYGILEGMRETVAAFNPIVFMEFNTLTTICVGNRNPRDLLKLFLEIFPEAFYFGRDNGLVPFGNDPAGRQYIFMNMVERGCVDDIVGRRKWGEPPR